MKAIETRYAGCNFRSRLEARWAVFFDHLGIVWEYEPQGFEIEHRLTLEKKTFPYLPDFWLPELKVWAEVKGSLDEDALFKVLTAAAYLSSEGGGGCGSGHNTVILGPVPDPLEPMFRLPTVLHFHKGDLEASAWNWNRVSGCAGEVTIANDTGQVWADGKKLERLLLHGMRWVEPPVHGAGGGMIDTGPVEDATRSGYTQARSARFEHGQTTRTERFRMMFNLPGHHPWCTGEGGMCPCE